MSETPSAYHLRKNNPVLDDLEVMVAYAKLCVGIA